MPLTKWICVLGVSLFATTGLACPLPPVIYFPPADELEAEVAPGLRYATSQYFTEMESYIECIQAELESAGGDDASPLVKSALVARNNVAVAEVNQVLQLAEETLEPLEAELEAIRDAEAGEGAAAD